MTSVSYPNEKYKQSEKLISIEKYVMSVIQRGELLPRYWNAQDRYKYYLNIIRELPHLLSFYLPEHSFSEHIHAFWHAGEKVGFLDCGAVTWMTEMLNQCSNDTICLVKEFEERIVEYATSRHFLRMASDRRYEQANKAKRLASYSRQLLSCYARSLVVRVDLSYYKDAWITIAEVYRHLDLLLLSIHRREGVFNGMNGYAWCIEQGGREGGYHLHVTLTYPGHLHQRDGYMANQFGLHWRQITDGRGRHFSCNAQKAEYSRWGNLGIGMIFRSDDVAYQNAVNAMGYLAKPEKDDQFLRMKPFNRRTFGAGTLTGKAGLLHATA